MNTVIMGALINGFVLLSIAVINKVSEYNLQKSKVKSTHEQEYENKKRDIYSKLASGLNVFIENRYVGDQKKKIQSDFYEAYDQIWIWGSEELNKKVGLFLQATLDKKDDKTLKRLHVEIILEMRRDLKMLNDNISIEDYKFITFTD